MLVHGIMSSIAEFYSLNLATEVTKGMVQKAAAGGTPTKAPVGAATTTTTSRAPSTAARQPPSPLRRSPALDLLKEEQDRLAHQLDLVTARLDALDTTYEEARTHLHECLALAGDCHSVYACGSDTTRRMANQAFFTRIYLDADDQITTEPTRPTGCCSTPPSSARRSPGPACTRTERSAPPEPSPLRTRVRVSA